MNEQEPGKYKILGESARVPGFALSIDSELSDPEKKKLTAILVGMGKIPEGKRALDAIEGSAGGLPIPCRRPARSIFPPT